ncbi:LysR family transcriptional regulator [Syntrophorhabdus aromaticivorans]|jgi:DNA-binding transcriptional LysR family regulator|uniref:LysR family transcriptional regulator n=1 Tax=Syntrophorhabdus aromaticivorans TaxID=328301 RepID=A0A351U4I5_9BACT|nr:LysR family transcriptional regulator [Syntrophorhabdus aromaticivorans]NLW35812.1 LysR family transcriptional regulator [Syntrophorhabdus aromaticivorans]HBA54866.1 LysR family transcriptional regulator [Syntrophorhabdus aromaticivorans]
MNLNQLRAFHSVIKTGTFSKAAEELCVTEPAVFIQVRSLERYLGFTLLDRFGKELRPTEIGKLLYDYADKIFTLVEEASRAVKELQELKKGCLRLGTSKPLAQYLMPVIVSSFQDHFPSITVYLDEGSTQELVEGILQHRFELAIVARVPFPEKINAIPFSSDDIVVVVSPQNKLLKKLKISMEELAEEPVICTDTGSATKLSIWTEFEKMGLKPSAIIEAGNIEFIKQLIKKNKGYTFLASICVREEVERGELATLSVRERTFSMDIDVIHLKGKTLSPAATSFLNFLQEHREASGVIKLMDELIKTASTA